MLVEIPTKYSVLSFMEFLKGKSGIVNGRVPDINIEIVNFNVEDIMLIQ